MLPSVKFIRLLAILALLAWSNVQAMACCWVMPDQISTQVTEVESGSVAEDHSCCPGGEAQSTSNEPISSSSHASSEDCGMSQHGTSSLCCMHSDPSEEAATFSPQFSFVQLALISYLLPALPALPQAVAPPLSLASSGPPRYLALERILI